MNWKFRNHENFAEFGWRIIAVLQMCVQCSELMMILYRAQLGWHPLESDAIGVVAIFYFDIFFKLYFALRLAAERFSKYQTQQAYDCLCYCCCGCYFHLNADNCQIMLNCCNNILLLHKLATLFAWMCVCMCT